MKKGKRYSFEFKVSNKNIEKDCLTKLDLKTKILTKALYAHGFIEDADENKKILIMGLDFNINDANCFYGELEYKRKTNFIGLYIDISVKFISIIHLSNEIKRIQDKIKEFKMKIKMKLKKFRKKIKMQLKQYKSNIEKKLIK